MEKYTINKRVLRQLSLLSNQSEPSIKILDSLYAQMVLEVSIFQFQKSKFQKEIDEALKAGDKGLFTVLANGYNEMLVKYKDGITSSEAGFEFTIKLEE